MNALTELLNMPETEKTARGLTYTPAEIAQQPDTWLSTFELFRRKRPEIRQFLSSAGFAAGSGTKPTVFLVGAGTSDYIGHSLAYLLRKLWHCEVIAVPSTDLLTPLGFVLPLGRQSGRRCGVGNLLHELSGDPASRDLV